MYESKPPAYYEKYSASALPLAEQPPLAFGQQTTTGIPVSTASQYYAPTQASRPHAALRRESKNKDPWSSGLFDCFSDCRNCWITCLCPCVTFGRIAEIVDKGSSACGVNGALYTLIACVTCCPSCYACFYRSKMRQQYTLKKSPCGDCLVHCFCEYCALCQEYRELKFRGYDMEIGWHGNVEKKRSLEMARSMEMASMPPVVEEGMSRESF